MNTKGKFHRNVALRERGGRAGGCFACSAADLHDASLKSKHISTEIFGNTHTMHYERQLTTSRAVLDVSVSTADTPAHFGRCTLTPSDVAPVGCEQRGESAERRAYIK